MNDGLDELWAVVAPVARRRVEVLERAVTSLVRDDPDGDAHRAEAVEEAHKLVGSLDSYGRSGGSALALRAAEILDQREPDVPELTDVVRRLRALVHDA